MTETEHSKVVSCLDYRITRRGVGVRGRVFYSAISSVARGIDGWVPFAKYWGPGPRIDVHYVATEHRHVSQDSLFSAMQCYYLPVNVNSLRDSRSVTDSGRHSETRFKLLL